MSENSVFSQVDKDLLCLAAYYLYVVYPGYKKAMKDEDTLVFERIAWRLKERLEKAKESTRLRGLVHYLGVAVNAMEKSLNSIRFEKIASSEGKSIKPIKNQRKLNMQIVNQCWSSIEHHYKDAIAAVCSVEIGVLSEDDELVQRVCI